jgi:hypothetical protein
MLAIENEPRSAAECYTSAIGASNLRMEAHRIGSADIIGAAGMNPYEIGVKLMRLQGEWDGAAKPLPPTRAAIRRIADELETVPIGQPHAGMVAQNYHGKVSYRKPQEVAERQAQEWHLHELSILASHLKTLPAVRVELEAWIGPPHAARIVADVLAWWLSPRCLTCRGAGKRIIQGTGGRDSGKVCFACRLSPTPGERPLPHSGIGRRLLAHIRHCYFTAAGEQASVKGKRTPEQEHERSMTKHHAQIEKLRRADKEASAPPVDREKAKEAFELGRRAPKPQR